MQDCSPRSTVLPPITSIFAKPGSLVNQFAQRLGLPSAVALPQTPPLPSSQQHQAFPPQQRPMVCMLPENQQSAGDFKGMLTPAQSPLCDNSPSSLKIRPEPIARPPAPAAAPAAAPIPASVSASPTSPVDTKTAPQSGGAQADSTKIPVVGTITVSQLKMDSLTSLFSCPTCGRKFKRKSDLVRHERIHTGEKPNRCAVCNKKFIQRSALRVHLRVHTGEKPYHCTICQRQFSDSSSLARHRKMHLRDNTRVIISPMLHTPCAKPYSQQRVYLPPILQKTPPTSPMESEMYKVMWRA